MNRKVLTFLLVLTCLSFYSRGQSSGDYEYSREFVWGITKATNSGLIGGLMFRYSRVLQDENFHGLSLEFVNVKHPQEQKVMRPNFGNTWILGKGNHLYSIRLSYSRERILFRKAPQQGIQINALAMLGPTIGLEAPYYVQVADGSGGSTQQPYDPALEGAIFGSGSFLKGLGDATVVPGLNTKLALAFEFGTYRSNVVGIEVGFQADLFSRDIILMPALENTNFFPNGFLTLYYGSRK